MVSGCKLRAQMFGILDQTTGFVVASIRNLGSKFVWMNEILKTPMANGLRRDGEELHRLATEKSMIEPTVIDP